MTERRAILLASRPQGEPTADNFRLETATLPDPGKGEILVRTIWLSLDPYMRGRMDDAKSYADPVELGDVMGGQGVGQVLASRHDGFAEGDIVVGMTGWADHAILRGDEARKLDPSRAPVQTALSVLGMTGLTAWAGLTEILHAKKGQTLAIGAATGAVGTVAAQLAKARGLTVIGIAGGEEKCRYATDELGMDACIDHHAHDDGKAMAKAIGDAAPQGIDLYFENVGGKTLAGIVPNMNRDGRIAICGMVAWYSGKNLDHAMPLPAVWRAILVNRLTVQGFLVSDHMHRMDDFVAELAPMVKDGRLKHREDVTEGLENAPQAFLAMLGGGNFGKTLVRVGPDGDA
ncbi:NADP-dependent oxidoreductase, L4bD family protein [Oceaniovalibus guishaninsula JLT2003]|uniref:NADP-dependent oxidoreductase, L4bD family protein n=1 Tax=Oceaniovalibus guishaninsula JLT2003 TaxID=1231392 RepID=K2HQ09_9RHOB|nr:NADP-dependent oxidoreductase [Oceaniovalibus guishaninsula]EKE44919.1 NADP-dependent oxidoreductase, L4bD family protein [Oceaniovalibus guishaninsula JLT2003]